MVSCHWVLFRHVACDGLVLSEQLKPCSSTDCLRLAKGNMPFSSLTSCDPKLHTAGIRPLQSWGHVTLLTSARASERPVRAHRGAMTRLLFPEALLWLPSSSMFLPVTTRAPFCCRLYTSRSLRQLLTLMTIARDVAWSPGHSTKLLYKLECRGCGMCHCI